MNITKYRGGLRSHIHLLRRFCYTQSEIADNIEYLFPSDLINIEKKWKGLVSRSCSEMGVSEKQKKCPGHGKRKYVLAMFPYPSGKLHMGHARVYTCSDSFAKFYYLNGYEVFHPIGWDAFGLPAENAAIQNGINPKDWTMENIKYMKYQLQNLGCSFDWDNELSTCDPAYIKATQSIFVMLHKRGMTYQSEALVNWDPVDKTVLANEQVSKDLTSWRSGAQVEKKYLKQWFIKTTKYAELLYDDLKYVLDGWADVSKLQKHWIGKPTGYRLWLTAKNEKHSVPLMVWIKNLENLRNASFISIKSNHPLARDSYIDKTSTNVTLLNCKVFEPLTKRYIPVVVCDDVPYPGNTDTYIASGDAEIENKIMNLFGITVQVEPKELSDIQQMIEEIEAENVEVYHCSPILHDWLISRQRYWGTPIPIVHCDSCGAVPVKEKDLPVLLPNITDCVIKGSTTLANQHDWVNTTCPKCNRPAKRETDTMDTFVDSSYYYLRYLDPNNNEQIVDKELAQKHMPVNLYLGGEEHALLHLFYSRFIHKFLASEGITSGIEPFQCLSSVGLVRTKTYTVQGSGKYLTEDEVDLTVSPPVEKVSNNPVDINYQKMSKSAHNGVDPQDMINSHGVDLTRLSLANSTNSLTSFLNWDKTDVETNLKVLRRVHRLFRQYKLAKSAGIGIKGNLSEDEVQKSAQALRNNRNMNLIRISLHVKKSTFLIIIIDKIKVLQQFLLSQPYDMILTKEYEKTMRAILLILFPICPHFSAEYWNFMNKYGGDAGDIMKQNWPHPESEMNSQFEVLINNISPFPGNVLSNNEAIAMDEKDALEMALSIPSVKEILEKSLIVHSQIKKSPEKIRYVIHVKNV